MEKYFDILRRCPLFEGTSETEITAMLQCLGARLVHFEKNELIFREGDEAKYVGVILSGGAQMMREDYYGNRSIMAHLEPGELFGETFACAQVKALPINILAVKDSEILLMDCQRITFSCSNACAFHARMIFNLLKVVSTKNLIFHQKIEVTSKRSTREKLMTYLLMQAKLQQSNRFTIPYDRQELADYLEVDRSGLSTQIGKLCKENVISCKGNEFVLL